MTSSGYDKITAFRRTEKTMTDRTAVRTGLLTVDGATLHHEVRGEGTLLVMMPGGSADAGLDDAIATDLADRWTVATFDPRGYSRSALDGPVTDQSPATHADDIVRLIDLLSPDGAPAGLFGSSSSAVVALAALARHPGRLSRVVAHEPPVVALLPDPEAGRALFAAVREAFRRDGVAAAMATMAAGLAPEEGASSGPEGEALYPERAAPTLIRNRPPPSAGCTPTCPSSWSTCSAPSAVTSPTSWPSRPPPRAWSSA